MLICSATDFIRGLQIIYGSGSIAPSGFEKINVDLNYKAGGEYVYICYSRNSIHGPPITDIQVFAGDSPSFPVQDGYTEVPGDLNKGAGGKYIYLHYTRSREDGLQPVREIGVKQAPNIYAYPLRNWVRVDQDCQEGTPGGWFSYVCLKR